MNETPAPKSVLTAFDELDKVLPGTVIVTRVEETEAGIDVDLIGDNSVTATELLFAAEAVVGEASRRICARYADRVGPMLNALRADIMRAIETYHDDDDVWPAEAPVRPTVLN